MKLLWIATWGLDMGSEVGILKENWNSWNLGWRNISFRFCPDHLRVSEYKDTKSRYLADPDNKISVSGGKSISDSLEEKWKIAESNRPILEYRKPMPPPTDKQIELCILFDNLDCRYHKRVSM